MSGARPPYFDVTPTNHAPWVAAVSITFLIYSIIGVVAKILYRLRLKAVKSYDWFIVAALLFTFVQSILLIRACVHGLGKHRAALSDSAFHSFQKARYDLTRDQKSILIFSQEYFAASLFNIVVHTLAKISVAEFVMFINPQKQFKIATYTVLGIVTAWGISSLFLLAFRCRLLLPWSKNAGHCLDEFSVYLGINLINIITDIALVVLPTIMMWGVQTSFEVKSRVISLFATRLLVPAIIILQTAYLRQHFDINDVSWTLVEPSIMGQIALTTTILTACVPSLKGVVEMFYSGASTFMVPTVYQGSYDNSGSHGGIIRSLIPNRFRSTKSGGQSQTSKSKNASHLRSKERGEQPHTIPERSESQTNLRDDVIMRTTEYEVAYYESGKNDPSLAKGTGSDASHHSTNVYHGRRI